MCDGGCDIECATCHRQMFPITFDIPIVDVAVEMIIQGNEIYAEALPPLCNFLCPPPPGDHTVGQIKENLWSLLRYVTVMTVM